MYSRSCMHAIVMKPSSSHPYKASMKHVGFSPDQARNHRARSAEMCPTSRIEGVLNPSKNVRPEAYFGLVAKFRGSATFRDKPCVTHWLTGVSPSKQYVVRSLLSHVVQDIHTAHYSSTIFFTNCLSLICHILNPVSYTHLTLPTIYSV